MIEDHWEVLLALPPRSGIASFSTPPLNGECVTGGIDRAQLEEEILRRWPDALGYRSASAREWRFFSER